MSVHPRPRGEHRSRAVHLPTARAGSSPPARGTHDRPASGCSAPARGTHGGIDGSSPPARGTRTSFAIWSIHVSRFIPARAGNTDRRGRAPCAVSAGSSPPARGTRHQRGVERLLTLGSSPPARGTRRRSRGAACSGSSPPARGTLVPHWHPRDLSSEGPVHPRPRGEHCRSKILHRPSTAPMHGSSPPARGTLLSRPARYRRLVGSSPPARGTHAPPVTSST